MKCSKDIRRWFFLQNSFNDVIKKSYFMIQKNKEKIGNPILWSVCIVQYWVCQNSSVSISWFIWINSLATNWSTGKGCITMASDKFLWCVSKYNLSTLVPFLNYWSYSLKIRSKSHICNNTIWRSLFVQVAH